MRPVNLGISLFDSVKLAEDVWQERLLHDREGNCVFIIILAIFLIVINGPVLFHRHRQKILFPLLFSSGLASWSLNATACGPESGIHPRRSFFQR